MEGGRPEWLPSFGTAIFAAYTEGVGLLVNALALRGVHRARSSPASRRRAARERKRSVLRGLSARDRWGWSARPGSSTIKVKVARSKGWTLAGVGGLLLLVALLLSFGLIWVEFNEETTLTEVVAASWAPIFAVVLVGVAIQTLRLVLVRPRMWVTDDEIVIWDGLLLWKVLRIPRTALAAIPYGEPLMCQVNEDVAQLTPFREELNLVLRMRDDITLPARRLRCGNWFWVVLALKDRIPQTSMPQRGRLVRELCVRVKEPRRVATDLDRWLGKARRSRRSSRRSITPITARSTRTAASAGRASRSRDGSPAGAGRDRERGRRDAAGLASTHRVRRGTPVAVCGPGAPPATTVLHDRLLSGKALTKRFLYVESEGRWTVTISGPERARAFAGSTTGRGPEVLAYQGPAGIAVVTCPDGQPHQVRLYGPNLDPLPGCDPVASTVMLSRPPGVSPHRPGARSPSRRRRWSR